MLVFFVQASSFLQDPGSTEAAAQQCTAQVRAALRTTYRGTGADKIAVIHKFRADCLSGNEEVRNMVSNKLLALSEQHLLAIMRCTNLHDVLLLGNVPLLRRAALSSRVYDGALSLSGCLSGKLKSKPLRNALGEYTSSISSQHLLQLDLSNNNISPSDKGALEHIFLLQPQLVDLDLSRNEDLAPRTIIPAMYALTSLLRLDLSSCFLYNDCRPKHILCYLGHFSHLQHLNMLQSPVSSSDLDACLIGKPFSTLHELTFLAIGACPGFTLKHAAALTHHLPQCIQKLTLSWDSQATGGPQAIAALPDGIRRLTSLTLLHFASHIPGSPTIFSQWLWRNHTAILSRTFFAIASLPSLADFSAPMLRAPSGCVPALAHVRTLDTLALGRLESPPGISRLTQLTKLSLFDARISRAEQLCLELQALTGLRSVALGGYGLTSSVLRTLRCGLAGAAPRMQCLYLSVNDSDSSAQPRSAEWPGVLAQLTALTQLNVAGWRGEATAPADVGRAVGSLRHLQHLQVTFAGDPGSATPQMGDGDDDADAACEACAALGRALKPLTKLTGLYLSGGSMRGADALLPELSALRHLNTLCLTHAELDEVAAAALSALLWRGGLPQLQELDLADNALTVAGMLVLAEALPAARQLRRLVLEGQCGNGYDRDRFSPDRDSESSLDMNPLMHPWPTYDDGASGAMSEDSSRGAGSCGVVLDEVVGDPSWDAETEEGDPWWENEAAAEKVWAALANLPLDLGVQL